MRISIQHVIACMMLAEYMVIDYVFVVIRCLCIHMPQMQM